VITAGIGFQNAGVNRKAFALHKASGHAGADHGLKNVAEKVAVANAAMPVLGKARVIGHGVIKIEAAEMG
jgi:hypothetical protein